MSALTSLLVRDHVVPVKKIEEAIQRQVISGGELATALLELSAAPEDVLSAYVAASMGHTAATRQQLMQVPRAVARIVPPEVAEEHRLVPLSVAGRKLTIAVGRPLGAATQQQLEFLLGMQLEVRIAADARVAAALSQHYGIDPAPRLRRLAERLSQQDPGAVPEQILPLETNLAPRAFAPSHERAEGPVNRAPERALAQVERPGVTHDRPQVATPVLDVAPEQREEPVDGARPTSELVARHRGPMTMQVAVDLLQRTDTRDDILAVSFAFVQQFFDYAALFVVHDDMVECIDTHKRGQASTAVPRVTGSLSLPGALEDVGRVLVPRVSRLEDTEADRKLATDLGREDAQPCVLFPVAIRERVVILFYGDRGGEDFGLADVPDLLGFVPRVSEAFQRLIVRRKRRAAEPAVSPPPPATWSKGASSRPAPPPPVTSAPPRAASALPAPPVSIPAPSRVPGVRSSHYDVLGVPRSAPPPPMIRPSIPNDAPVPPPPVATPERLPSLVRSARDPSPSPPAEEKPDDDEPELIVEESDDDALFDDLEFGDEGVSAGFYRQRGGPSDVLSRRSLELSNPSGSGVSPTPREPAPSASAVAEDGESGEPALADFTDEDRPTLPQAHVPKVIVSMGDWVEAIVQEICYAPPDELDECISRARALGPAALPMLVQAFPGPVWRGRVGSEAPTHPRELSAVAATIAAFGDEAAPYIVTLFDDESADIRYYAFVTASELLHRDLVAPAGVRLFDRDHDVSALAMALLWRHRRFGREFQRVLDKVRATARSPRVSDRRRARALSALGELRDARSLRALLQFLPGPEPLAQAAHASLVTLTRQDLGRTEAAWEAWMEENAARHRIEWLIDALQGPTETLRRAASEELKQLTQEYHGYHPALPRKEREQAQRRYRSWWEAEGKLRFK